MRAAYRNRLRMPACWRRLATAACQLDLPGPTAIAMWHEGCARLARFPSCASLRSAVLSSLRRARKWIAISHKEDVRLQHVPIDLAEL
jgi:hypothetical protein